MGRGKEDGRIKRVGMEWEVWRQDGVGMEGGVGVGRGEVVGSEGIVGRKEGEGMECGVGGKMG